MTPISKFGLSLALVLLATGSVTAAPPHTPPRPGAGRPPAHGEPHAGPTHYQRVAPPAGWDARPPTVDRPTFQHNFQAARSYRIGPYVRPPGWVAHRWVYGQILPPVYWTAPYILADYWLFALSVPPVGYEWVRDDDDAILVNTANGEILQVQYGVFA
jgi:Ni/Co efflux regulator RcnB